MEERLQKIISRAGVASRRHAEQMILSGMVTVNGRMVTELGTKADPSRDHIKVAGRLLRGPAQSVYLAFNKPMNVVASLSDPEGRRSLTGFLRGVHGHVYPIGRLEYSATGLLLLTNDGELTNRAMRSRNLWQTYYFKLKGSLNSEELAAIETTTGVRLERARSGDNPWYEATLSDASGDRLREKLRQMGHLVEKTKRVRIGPIDIGSLKPGESRALVPEELAALEKAIASAGRGSANPNRGRTAERRATESRPTERRAVNHPSGGSRADRSDRRKRSVKSKKSSKGGRWRGK
jgi:23S rRNA pseudouridine2605 synthase